MKTRPIQYTRPSIKKIVTLAAAGTAAGLGIYSLAKKGTFDSFIKAAKNNLQETKFTESLTRKFGKVQNGVKNVFNKVSTNPKVSELKNVLKVEADVVSLKAKNIAKAAKTQITNLAGKIIKH